ncbi:hypothetical protein [Shinella sp.]|uniref:hypothetical protein n=1 Tax=Shinella sp. TaxID=1870904 RepID=UPI0039E377F4
MANEPGAAVLTIFETLVDRIKQMSPARTDDKPLGSMVYSQLLLGMPIWKDDYYKPWTPVGGASLREAVKADGTAAPEGAAPGSVPAPDDRYLRAMQAAWKTSLLCRTMLEVTSDGTYREYPTGRHLDFAYESILKGMQPGQEPEMAPEVKQRIADAEKVLFELDEDGSIIGKKQIYKNYITNAQALAKAKADYAVANAAAMADPQKAAAWPVTSATYQQIVDAARDALASEGGPKVERALDTIASVGVPMQAHMISKARDMFDNWSLGLSGVVPGAMPYSMVMPTNWCDYEDSQGFERLTITNSEYHSHVGQQSSSASQQSWSKHASKTSGGGGVSFGFINFAGKGSSSSRDSSWQNSSEAHFSSNFQNSAKNLTIDLEYGLCTIVRPWLISDLFYLKNWYLVGTKKNSISDGTIDGQKDSQEKLLPMIPQQFLVVRNVKITSTDWGADSTTLSNMYSGAQGSTHSGSSSGGGGGGVALGFINFGGAASHSSSNASGQSSAWQARDSDSYCGTTFDGQTLEIKGTQIVGFLSDIVPAGPELDDPGQQ